MLRDLFVRAGHDVVAETSDASDLLPIVEEARPDLALLDIRLPPSYTSEGIEAAGEILRCSAGTGVLVLSQHVETQYALELVEHGATGTGYLLKDRVQDGSALVDAAERVADGGTVMDPEVVGRLARQGRSSGALGGLSPGELEVLALMAEGWSNAAIGERAHLSTKTVEKRITTITQKLDLPPAQSDRRRDLNVRVLAVLRYLRSSGIGTRAALSEPARVSWQDG